MISFLIMDGSNAPLYLAEYSFLKSLKYYGLDKIASEYNRLNPKVRLKPEKGTLDTTSEFCEPGDQEILIGQLH